MSYQGSIQLPGSLLLRFATPKDKTFLLDLFMAARPWLAESHPDPDFIRALYEDQLRINGIGQGNTYPNHLDFVIEKTDQAVGHVVMHLGREEWRIAQLELHPLARGKGIGSDVVRGVQAGAERARVILTAAALTDMPQTMNFYRRLGFRRKEAGRPFTELAWYPPGMAPVLPAGMPGPQLTP